MWKCKLKKLIIRTIWRHLAYIYREIAADWNSAAGKSDLLCSPQPKLKSSLQHEEPL